MARPKKQTVEYFPHYTTSGKTMFIIESKFGNDGYAFWYKVLELLGNTNGMYYNCNNVADWGFLLAKTHVNEQLANDILNTLADLGAIDTELWRKGRVIWSQNLVNNVNDAFKRRVADIPKKPLLHTETPLEGDKCLQKPSISDVSANKNGESKVKESKVNKTKEKESIEKKSFAEFVSMTNDEYAKLVATYGEEAVKQMIQILDNYKGSNGKKYKSDYRTILNWVVQRYQEEKQQENKSRAASGGFDYETAKNSKYGW